MFTEFPFPRSQFREAQSVAIPVPLSINPPGQTGGRKFTLVTGRPDGAGPPDRLMPGGSGSSSGAMPPLSMPGPSHRAAQSTAGRLRVPTAKQPSQEYDYRDLAPENKSRHHAARL